ncbi:hypothetical protein LCGC14_0244040 [marine sediment metagenome]|uniref:Uncharacterized protein n=1 Tax=marine sediment metagenome TaxID=412755 RepID=A0A0F9UMU6_9ZZZZ
MDQVLLAFVEWGREHWIFFGWTAFWGLIFLILCTFQFLRTIFFVLPNRILRTIKVTMQGWPPEHLDADGDWKPEPKTE